MIFCKDSDFRLIADEITKNGFELFGDRKIEDCHILNLTGSARKIDRVGCALVGLQASYPRDVLDFVLVDSDGLF